MQDGDAVEGRLTGSLNEEMGPCGVVWIGEIEAVGDPTGGEAQVALRVRRDGPQPVSPRVDGERLDPVGLRPSEVLGLVLAGAEGQQALAKLALVEAGAAVRGDCLQGAGKPQLANDGPFRRVVGGDRVGLSTGKAGDGHRGTRLRRCGGEAIGGVRLCRREDVGEREAAEALVESHPPVDAAGHRNAADVAGARHLAVSFGAQAIRVGARTRPPGRVQRRGRPGTVVDECEQVAAHAALVLAGDGEHRSGGDCGIRRAPSRLQHGHARVRREVVDGTHHPAGRHPRDIGDQLQRRDLVTRDLAVGGDVAAIDAEEGFLLRVREVAVGADGGLGRLR